MYDIVAVLHWWTEATKLTSSTPAQNEKGPAIGYVLTFWITQTSIVYGMPFVTKIKLYIIRYYDTS